MFFTSSPAYTIFIRLKFRNLPGMLGNITAVIMKMGGEVRGINLVETSKTWVVRDIHVNVRDGAHAKEIVKADIKY
jgi:malate dehydrogenase (oxaloacetate-decarboxylating)